MKKIFSTFILVSLLSGCQVENIQEVAPLMTTYEPQNVYTTSATLGGATISEGGSNITEYGIVYSTNENPTINDNKVIEGERLGDFIKNYNVFEGNTTYYYRAYGSNAVGTGYGETYSFTTASEPACSFETENLLYMGAYFENKTVSYINIEYDNTSAEGNVIFTINFNNTAIFMRLTFNELNQRLPYTGEYQTIYGFDIGETLSQSKVKLELFNYNFTYGGIPPMPGNKIYVENDGNGNVTFIFCNEEFNEYYTLNGSITYHE